LVEYCVLVQFDVKIFAFVFHMSSIREGLSPHP
jgi:hypothetical protein